MRNDLVEKSESDGKLDAIWQGDLLHRRDDARFLKDFLIAKLEERRQRKVKRSFVLNIDAGWGHGKSYFLAKFHGMLTADGFVVANINAWNDDHAEDPLIAVMAGIGAGVKGNSNVKGSAKTSMGRLALIGGQLVAAGAKGLLKQTAIKYLGEDAIENLSEIVGAEIADAAGGAEKEIGSKLGELYDAEGKALIEKFNRAKQSIADFKKQLGNVLESIGSKSKLPLFILVDELDRCRPPYAVALLERVKHLFEVDDVVFVLATDTSQLRHSIKALYGSEFDAARYLLRFFDQTYRFEAPAIKDFVAAQFAGIDDKKLYASPDLTPVQFTAKAFAAFGLSLRDIEQCIDVLKNCVTVWADPSPLVLVALLPLVVAQQQRIIPRFSLLEGELTNCLGVPREVWRVDFGIWDQGVRRIFEGWKVFEMLGDLAGREALPRIINRGQSKNAEDRLAEHIFQQEFFARVPGGNYMSNDPPFSLIRDYPALVRSVGRLAPG